LMRYPIFLFDRDEEGRGDLAVYDAPEDHWVDLESYDIHWMILYDSEGRRLTASDAGEDRVEITDSGADPNPERLRRMLITALRWRGQEWSDGASLESLIAAAQELDSEPSTIDIGKALSGLWSRLLRLLRLKGPES